MLSARSIIPVKFMKSVVPMHATLNLVMNPKNVRPSFAMTIFAPYVLQMNHVEINSDAKKANVQQLNAHLMAIAWNLINIAKQTNVVK